MSTINYYLDKPFNSDLNKEELDEIIKSHRIKNRPLPLKAFNPNPTSIYLKVYFGKNLSCKFKTQFNRIEPKYWDFKNGNSVKSTFENYEQFNNDLNTLKSKVKTQLDSLSLDGTKAELDDIKNQIEPIINGLKISDKGDFFRVFDEFIVYHKKIRKPGTIQEYLTIYKSLKDYELIKSTKLSFEKMKIRFFDDYEIFLSEKKNPKAADRGLLNDTIRKYLETLKVFLKWSFEYDYHTNTSYNKIKPKFKTPVKNDIVTLNFEEINKLYNFDLSNNPRLEKVRDLFCFSCLTGQRWSDVSQFSKEDFKDDTWVFYMYKTGKYIELPIRGWMKPAINILEKYEYILPKISSQKFNDYLKELGELVGINEEKKIQRFSGQTPVIFQKRKFEFMSSHMARRSFITNCINDGMPLPYVMKLSGHSDIRTMLKYVNSEKEQLIESMEKHLKER